MKITNFDIYNLKKDTDVHNLKGGRKVYKLFT